jgi:TctA family transporter
MENTAYITFIICLIAYSVVKSQHKKDTGLAAFLGFIVGILLGVFIESVTGSPSTGRLASSFGYMFSGLFALMHSRRHRLNQATPDEHGKAHEASAGQKALKK